MNKDKRILSYVVFFVAVGVITISATILLKKLTSSLTKPAQISTPSITTTQSEPDGSTNEQLEQIIKNALHGIIFDQQNLIDQYVSPQANPDLVSIVKSDASLKSTLEIKIFQVTKESNSNTSRVETEITSLIDSKTINATVFLIQDSVGEYQLSDYQKH